MGIDQERKHKEPFCVWWRCLCPHRSTGWFSSILIGEMVRWVYTFIKTHIIVLLRSENIPGWKLLCNEKKNHISKEWQSWNFKPHLNSNLMVFSHYSTLLSFTLNCARDFRLWFQVVFWAYEKLPHFCFPNSYIFPLYNLISGGKKRRDPLSNCIKLLNTAGMPINAVPGSAWTYIPERHSHITEHTGNEIPCCFLKLIFQQSSKRNEKYTKI